MQFVQNFWDVLAAVAQSHFGPWLGLAILATIVTFGMTAWRRNTVDKALRAAASLGSKPLRLFDLSYGDAAGAVDVKVAVAPERLWSYDEIYLDHFRDKAGGALATYTNSVLRWDVLFAFCLASFIVLFWLAAVAAASFPPLFGRLAIFCECMGILYGFADIAEDLKLMSILNGPRPADPADAAAANALTRIKFAAILLSIVGALTFAVLSGGSWLIGRLAFGCWWLLQAIWRGLAGNRGPVEAEGDGATASRTLAPT